MTDIPRAKIVGSLAYREASVIHEFLHWKMGDSPSLQNYVSQNNLFNLIWSSIWKIMYKAHNSHYWGRRLSPGDFLSSVLVSPTALLSWRSLLSSSVSWPPESPSGDPRWWVRESINIWLYIFWNISIIYKWQFSIKLFSFAY